MHSLVKELKLIDKMHGEHNIKNGTSCISIACFRRVKKRSERSTNNLTHTHTHTQALVGQSSDPAVACSDFFVKPA
jgi:hypothetical protein